MPRIKVNYAVIQHIELDSKIATAAGLFNEWLKWCKDHNIDGYAVSHIADAFKVVPGSKEAIAREAALHTKEKNG